MADESPLAHSPTLAAGAPRASSDDDVQLAAGASVGDYVIERFIGAGAMGEVYAGRHPVIGKRVAIKVLRHELAASSEAAERFIREARAVNQIEHENVVDVFAFGRLDGGRLYLVMDLVEGRSLRAHLVDGPLQPESALDILDVIAGALDAAHSRGVVHRDLKPDNIVLSSATPPKVFVLDFGLAKLISKANEGKPTGPGTLTGAGTWLGTPGYMAPEQWSVDGAGPASDRYALGVIAFELFAGALPFSATSVPAMMEQHFRAEVPPLSARGAIGIPRAVDGVLRKALAKDPDARFASGRAMVDALRAAVGTARGNARGAVAGPSSPRKLPIPAIAGTAVLGVGLVVVVLARGDRDPTASPRPNADSELPAGNVTIDVLSTPPGADVHRASGMKLGSTPLLGFHTPPGQLELVVRKPGYLPERRTVMASDRGTVVQVSLAEVTRFRGTWRLANGELRHFERRGDEVDTFKLREVAGERELFKQYRFEPADHGIAFGGEEIVIDPRGPNDPNCRVRGRVDYHYDPTNDALEQRIEKVKVGFRDGTCFVQSRDVEPIKLVRVGDGLDTHEISMPAGKPLPADELGNPRGPLDNAFGAREQQERDEKLKQTRKLSTKRPPAKQPPSKSSKGAFAIEGSLGNTAPMQKQANLPRKPTATPPKTADGEAQKSLTPPPQAQVVPEPQVATPQVQDNAPQQPIPQQLRKK